MYRLYYAVVSVVQQIQLDASPTYKASSNSLEIDIRDNKEETVEIIVTHKGMPIFYDTIIFEEDKVEVDIPKQLVDETAVFCTFLLRNAQHWQHQKGRITFF